MSVFCLHRGGTFFGLYHASSCYKNGFFRKGGDFIRQTTPCTCFLFRVRPNALLAPLADGLGDGLGSICEKKKKEMFLFLFSVYVRVGKRFKAYFTIYENLWLSSLFFLFRPPSPLSRSSLLFSSLTLLLSSYRSSSSSFFLFPPICV